MKTYKDGWYSATHRKSNTETRIKIESGVACSEYGMGDAINEVFKSIKYQKTLDKYDSKPNI